MSKNSNKQLAYIKVEHNPKYLLQLTQYMLHMYSNYTLLFSIDQQLCKQLVNFVCRSSNKTLEAKPIQVTTYKKTV